MSTNCGIKCKTFCHLQIQNLQQENQRLCIRYRKKKNNIINQKICGSSLAQYGIQNNTVFSSIFQTIEDENLEKLLFQSYPIFKLMWNQAKFRPVTNLAS